MESHNQDVFAPNELIKLFDVCRPVFTNPRIDAAFLRYERIAVAAKRNYHRQGRIGGVLVLVSVLFTVAEALIIPVEIPVMGILSFAAILIGILGVGVQIHLIMTGKKKSWLVSRFAAERLRSIKFQAYQLAYVARSEDDLAARVDAFYVAELSRLHSELNAGEAALSLFSPKVAVTKLETPMRPVSAALSTAMQDSYRELRLKYQLRFATGEIQKLRNSQRVGYALADILYMTGAILSIVALISKLFGPFRAEVANGINFAAIAAFIVGLTLTIFENASLSESAMSRYEDYVRALQEQMRDLSTEHVSFPEMVRRIECVVMGEFGEFCSAASRISYRI
jgi:hypothetical protein